MSLVEEKKTGAGAAATPRVAVIGCGYWGKNLVRVFAELGALSALVDAHPPTVAALQAKHGGRAMGFEEALGDDEIDAIAIAAPAALHYRLAKEALKAGKHVFVEKPLALEVAEAQELCELAERLDRRLMVGHLLQYHPAFLKLKELVREGRLGRLQYL
jgi:UDP-2-acetamido-3-amino-2,3-dideoxy-glucuronate N-acetyltransferase